MSISPSTIFSVIVPLPASLEMEGVFAKLAGGLDVDAEAIVVECAAARCISCDSSLE